MEIELPDGTVLDAPEGADIKAVVRGYRRQQLAAQNPTEYNPQSPEYREKYGTETSAPVSFFSGVRRMDQGFGNIAQKYGGYTIPGIMGKLAGNRVSDEAIRSSDIQDKELIRQHPFSRIGGEVAATLPLSMATGGTATGLGAAGTAGRVLANPYGRAVVEGALTGAAGAPAEDQGAGAGKGAALGATLQALFGVTGRAVRGIIQKSKEMQDLEQIFGQHGETIQPPISQSAGDQDIITRLGKSFYQEALPLIPGVKGKLERQAKEAVEKTRELALKEATPTGMTIPEGSGARAGETLHGIRAGLQETEKDILESFEAKLFPDMLDDIGAKVRAKVPHIDDTSIGNVLDDVDQLIARFSGGAGKIEGQNLKYIVDELTKKAAKAPAFEKTAYETARDHLDEILHNYARVQKGGAYHDLQEPLRYFTGLEAAVNAARVKGGNFSMADLARKAKDPAQLDLASTANSVLSQPATKASLTGRILAGAGIGGFGAYMSPLAAGGALLGGNIMATKAFQRAMMGDTQAQEALKLFLSQHPQLAEQVASAVRAGSASQVE